MNILYFSFGKSNKIFSEIVKVQDGKLEIKFHHFQNVYMQK